jgi:hypothetical protein
VVNKNPALNIKFNAGFLGESNIYLNQSKLPCFSEFINKIALASKNNV